MVCIVYMVAGMSSRFGGKIKQFAKVGPNGETLIEFSLNQAISAGFNKVIFVVGEKTASPFKKMFGNEYKGIPISYANQEFDASKRDKPWGTADALISANDLVSDDFVVCNGDDLYGENTFRKMREFATKNPHNDCATIGYNLMTVIPCKGTVNRGIFTVDENNYLIRIDETLGISKDNLGEHGLAESSISSQNIFFLKLGVLAMLKEKLIKFKEAHQEDRTSECYLPTELSNLVAQGKIKIKVLETPDKWLGVTNPEDEEILRQELASQN